MARTGLRNGRNRSGTAAGQHLAAGIERHRSGDLAGAAEQFRAALALEPRNADALHLLGVVHHLAKDSGTAVGLLRMAAALSPRNGEVRSNLGAALLAAGDAEAAVESFHSAAALDPGRVETHGNLGAALARLGRTEAAIESFRTAHRLRPQAPRFVRRLAELTLTCDRLAEAIDWFSHYLALAPEDADAQNNAAYACERLGRLNDAATYYRAALDRRPDSPEIANNLATVLKRLGHVEEADRLFERALAAPAERWEDESHHAGLLFNRGRVDEALTLYAALAAGRPDDARLLTDYAQMLLARDRTADAEAVVRRALTVDPAMTDARIALGLCLLRQKRSADALRELREAVAAAPHHVTATLALCDALLAGDEWDDALNVARGVVRLPDFRPAMAVVPHQAFRMTCAFGDIDELGITVGSIGVDGLDTTMVSSGFLHALVLAGDDAQIGHLADLHRRWGETIMATAEADPLPPAAAGPRRHKVRLGFLSSDLRSHSVGRFVLPLIEHYDRDRFEIFCYTPEEVADDPVQRAIRRQVEGFRIVRQESHRDLALAIRNDGIDILFELNGFTGESRLKTMAYRPAPVQVYWLGYPFTTGLRAMDYILLDPRLVPTRPDWLVEQPLLMPESWVCYDPFQDVPVTAAPPVERNGYVTFGSLNNPYKITRDAVALWARVMTAVPDSRFRYVRGECNSAALRANLTVEFGRHGIAADRVVFENNRSTKRLHFECYADIDLALDTMPLTGGTTTVDALWMGVAVVTLEGPSLHQRLSRSLLYTAGLADLCAETPDEFVARAVALARDVSRLRGLRHGLRARLARTPLCDRATFARQFGELMMRVVERHGLR